MIMIYFAYIMAWVSTSIAASVAVYVTKSAHPLWVMFIPVLININGIKDNSN